MFLQAAAPVRASPRTGWPGKRLIQQKLPSLSAASVYNNGLFAIEEFFGESAHMELWMGFAEGGIREWLPPFLNIVLLLIGLFLILLVLIQKGKGGGLAGAFGGAGGSSAFGSRAGDTFTRITIYVAAVWILLIMILIKLVQPTTTTPSSAEIQAPPPVEQQGQGE
jgi:preprotein translocase subunit SecG